MIFSFPFISKWYFLGGQNLGGWVYVCGAIDDGMNGHEIRQTKKLIHHWYELRKMELDTHSAHLILDFIA